VAYGFLGGAPPHVDLAAERRLVDLLVSAAARGLVCSAHDCAQGGLGVALAEAAFGAPYDDAGFGLTVDLTGYAAPLSAHEVLFSESHGRAVLTCEPDHVNALLLLARELGVPASRVGHVGDRDGTWHVRVRDGEIREPIARLRRVYSLAIPRRMGD
jgi:phosphoribosylformylglycinamidine synthase